MMTLIRNWEELSKVPANDKYKIIVDNDMCSGWIVPICDTPHADMDFICNCKNVEGIVDFYNHHVYLSTHTFYGSNYKYSTKLLQKYGFNVEIDNWDKVRK